MLICGDGTGDANDIAYGNKMQHSFVKTIYNDSKIENKLYYRGPDITGIGEKLTRLRRSSRILRSSGMREIRRFS